MTTTLQLTIESAKRMHSGKRYHKSMSEEEKKKLSVSLNSLRLLQNRNLAGLQAQQALILSPQMVSIIGANLYTSPWLPYT